MPECTHCAYKWSWDKLLANMLIPKMYLHCPDCGKKQYFTAKSRKKTTYLTAIIPAALVLVTYLKVPTLLYVLILSAAAFLVACLLPFLAEFTDKEDPFR